MGSSAVRSFPSMRLHSWPMFSLPPLPSGYDGTACVLRLSALLSARFRPFFWHVSTSDMLACRLISCFVGEQEEHTRNVDNALRAGTQDKLDEVLSAASVSRSRYASSSQTIAVYLIWRPALSAAFERHLSAATTEEMHQACVKLDAALRLLQNTGKRPSTISKELVRPRSALDCVGVSLTFQSAGGTFRAQKLLRLARP